MPYRLVPINGVTGTERRAVVFLAGDAGDRLINAHEVQDDKGQSGRTTLNHLRTAIDYYLGGHTNKKRHHGWDQTQNRGRHVECYVFKDLGQDLRFYGFVFSPPSNRRLMVVAIVHMATKFEYETEISLLDRIVALKRSAAVQDAVSGYAF